MRAFTSHQRTKPPMRLPRWRRRPLPCRSLHPWTWRRRRRWQQVGRPPTRRARLCGAPRRGPRRRVVTAPARPPCRRGRPRRRWACPAAARQPAATARRWCRRRCWRRWGRGEPPAGRRSRCRRRTRWRTVCSRRRRKRQRLGGGGRRGWPAAVSSRRALLSAAAGRARRARWGMLRGVLILFFFVACPLFFFGSLFLLSTVWVPLCGCCCFCTYVSSSRVSFSLPSECLGSGCGLVGWPFGWWSLYRTAGSLFTSSRSVATPACASTSQRASCLRLVTTTRWVGSRWSGCQVRLRRRSASNAGHPGRCLHPTQGAPQGEQLHKFPRAGGAPATHRATARSRRRPRSGPSSASSTPATP